MTNAKKGGEVFRQNEMGAALNDGVVASRYLARTENMIAVRARSRVEEIRPSVASKLKITVSAANFIRRGRRKVVPSWLMEKIITLFIETAQAELRAIEHEIEVARQIGLDPRDDALVAAKTRAAALVAVLDGAVREGAPGSPR